MDNIAIRERLKSYFETGDKPTQAQFAELIGSSLYSVEKVLYEDLVSLRKSSKLIPGQFYRILDYVTTTTQANTQSAGHQFDIIILALSESEISEQAWACHSERDTDGYFANSKLSAWQIWYCLDNDTSRFAWADSANGKGVIYRMIDEWNNDCPYDFKNIQVTTEDIPDTYAGFYYTFSTLNKEDVSIKHDIKCSNNTLKSYFPTTAQHLNFIVHILEGSTELIANSYEEGCNNMLFIGRCFENSFGKGCFNILSVGGLRGMQVGSECSDLSFGLECRNSKFENYCRNITMGSECNYNYFGNSCHDIIVGDACKWNTFGVLCYNITFGNNVVRTMIGNASHDNTLADNCAMNTFGAGCYGNSLGTACSCNSFGNNCRDNNIGDSSGSNSFGNECFANVLGVSCKVNHFGDGCKNNELSHWAIYNKFHNVTGVKLLNDGTGSANQSIRNYEVVAVSNQTISATRGLAYSTRVTLNSSKQLKTFCLADLI